MIHMEDCLLSLLGEAAILTAVTRARAHATAQRWGNAAHAADRLRVRVARILRRLRNSAISTNPSASFRSAEVRGVPASCLSRRACSRSWTALGSRMDAMLFGISTVMVMRAK